MMSVYPSVLWRVFPKNQNILLHNHSNINIDIIILANLETFLFRLLQFLSQYRCHTCVSWGSPRSRVQVGIEGQDGWKAIPGIAAFSLGSSCQAADEGRHQASYHQVGHHPLGALWEPARNMHLRVIPPSKRQGRAKYCFNLKIHLGVFPGGPVVRTSCIHCQGPGFNPWSGN